MKQIIQIWLLQGIIGLNFLSPYLVIAQIIPDQSLPENSIVTPQGNTLQINGGTKAGNNLFHSFQEFSVPTNNTAAFNNAIEIQNIFSRVTGSSISNIDGIIKANGTANLFLINPNGLVFGPNAALNLGGSFVASTANRVIFSDGFEFSTNNPQATPLLTINVPIGLGFGNSLGQITNRSRATVSNNLIGRTRDPKVAGLQVKDGKTLALVGGNVILNGGNLTANSGRIEIGGVAGNNIVSLTPIEKGWQFGYEGVQAFQDISFFPRTIIDTSGNVAGDIQLQGKQITLTGDQMESPVLAFSNIVGEGQAGSIVANASEMIKISGDFSGLQTESEGKGTAGSIFVNTEKLILSEGGQIISFASESDKGKAGDISIISKHIEMTSKRGSNTAVVTEGFQGDGGAISIQTENLFLRNGAQISASTRRDGNAGNIAIKASLIEVNGRSNDCLSCYSAIAAQSNPNNKDTGNAGNINIETEQLKVFDNGFISTSTFGRGQGGKLEINAFESIVVENVGKIYVVATNGSSGNGGELLITTRQLFVDKEGDISSQTVGLGNAGNMTLNVEQLSVTDGGKIRASSSLRLNQDTLRGDGTLPRGEGGTITINATDSVNLRDGSLSTRAEGTGNAGNIILNTNGQLIVGKGAIISANTFSTGNAGNIALNVGKLIVDGGEISSGSLLGNSTPKRGAGGTITINATDVNITNGSLSTQAQSTGDAGSITFNTNGQLIVGQGAEITANTSSTGNAGNINLNVGQLLVQDGGEISSGSLLGENPSNLERGAGGTITINATDSVNITNGRISTQAQGTGDAGNIFINTNNLNLTDAGQINATTNNIGQAGNIDVTASNLSIGKDASISVETNGTGNAGNITLNIGQLAILDRGQVLANTTNAGQGGTIIINATDVNITNGSISTQTQGTGDAGSITFNTNGQLIVGQGAAITANTSNTGNAGNIILNLGQLLVQDGGEISSGSLLGKDNSNLERGAGGTITINATESVSINGTSRLFTLAESTGDAGNISINTNNLSITDGAQITASTLGLGKAGTISVQASTFTVSQGGQLLTTTSGTQDAGDIEVQADTINLTGVGSGLFANTEEGSSGAGGNILVIAPTTNIQDGATISVNSQGTGIGGDITLQGNSLTLNNQAALSAETNSNQGGNITLTLNDLLLLRNQSNISATAGLAGSAGDGGNISITSPFILAVPEENSNITANAGAGKGGNVNINTQGIFGIQFREELTPLSDITVSSAFGQQGTVTIINPNADITGRLVEFPETPVDVSSLIAQNVCSVEQANRSSFVITGRGGLPANPSDPPTQNGTVDWATRSQQPNQSPVILKERSQNNQPVLQQIQGWKIESDGTIILTADATHVTPKSPVFNAPNCGSK